MDKDEKMSGYELSRNWFDWSFENPEKIKPIHSALYYFAVEHRNRLGWKEKFGLPTEMAKAAIGVKSWHTYIAAFNDLVDWGFFKLIERSKNQYSSNIIALSKNIKAHNNALDKAMTKHASKHQQSTHQSINSIDKQTNNRTIEQVNIVFDIFWDLYDKKVGDKEKLIKKWSNMSDDDRTKIIQHIPKYKIAQPEKKFRKDPSTYFNNKSWNDEVIYSEQATESQKNGYTPTFMNNYEKVPTKPIIL